MIAGVEATTSRRKKAAADIEKVPRNGRTQSDEPSTTLNSTGTSPKDVHKNGFGSLLLGAITVFDVSL